MSKKKKKKNKVKLIPRNINTTTPGLFDWSELFRRRKNNIMIAATEARKITEESRSMLQKTIDEIDYYIDDAAFGGKPVNFPEIIKAAPRVRCFREGL
mgnify:CR=1 FL=1